MNQPTFDPLMIVILLMGVMMVFGIVIVIVRLRGASAAGGQWAQLGYRPVAGDTRVGLGRQTTHLVRDYIGYQVHYLSSHKAGFGKMQMSVSWVCPLTEAAQFGLQVVEAGLADDSVGAKVSKAIDRYKYNWQPRFTQSLTTGDPQFDSRFAIFGTHPDKALRLLQDPAVREAILSLKHVDLTVAESEARFEDPFFVNQWNLSGKDLVDVHNQIAMIITRAATAVSQQQ